MNDSPSAATPPLRSGMNRWDPQRTLSVSSSSDSDSEAIWPSPKDIYRPREDDLSSLKRSSSSSQKSLTAYLTPSTFFPQHQLMQQHHTDQPSQRPSNPSSSSHTWTPSLPTPSSDLPPPLSKLPGPPRVQSTAVPLQPQPGNYSWLVFKDECWQPFDIVNQSKLEHTLSVDGTFVDITDSHFPGVKRVRVFPRSSYLSYLGVKYRLSRIMQPDAWGDH
ncbi:hypothetical protein DM01DRAFT_1336457 [Hesseltinella vesiculosa]|uniref:WWE domain-containing protein n=1 Tax=Hesseltinella vesiculosa TaxID=101127 RepID=A0A1X2GFI9_9FUNG|nr:hypothetical protein DM01DRAFT_1336457 [Hesseltinella vesiculosa]